MARRTGFHAVLDFLPTLSRGELLNVAFRVAGLTGSLIEAPQELLLQTKARMQQVLRAARDERNEAVMKGDIEAADRWTVEYEAQQRAARGRG